MSDQAYQTKLVQAIAKLYQEWDEILEKVEGWGIAYRIVRPWIPQMLSNIDQDEELRGKIRDFVKKLSDTIEEEEKPSLALPSDESVSPTVKWERGSA